MDRASDSGSECWGFESLRAYHKGASLRLAPLFFGDIRNHGDGSCDRAFPIPGGRWHGAAMTDEGEYRWCAGHRGPTQYPQGVCRIRKAPSSPTAAQRSAPTRAIVTRRRGGPPCPPVDNGCTPAGPPHPPLRGTFPPAWGRLISFMTVPQGAGKATRPCWSFSVVPYYRNRGETEVSM